MTDLSPAEKVIQIAEKVFAENKLNGPSEEFIGELLHNHFHYQETDYSSYLIGTGLTMKDIAAAAELWEQRTTDLAE